MSATVLTGPILAGNVLQSDGSGTLAGAGAMSGGSQNVGFTQMIQSVAITQANTTGGLTTSIVLPAGSQILSMSLNIGAAWSAAATLNIGNTVSATAYANVIPNASLAVGQYIVNPGAGSGGATQVGNWNNVGSTQDVQLVVTSSGTGTGTAQLLVEYIQGFNLFAAGQYT
jgi:hypothetical protein